MRRSCRVVRGPEGPGDVLPFLGEIEAVGARAPPPSARIERGLRVAHPTRAPPRAGRARTLRPRVTFSRNGSTSPGTLGGPRRHDQDRLIVAGLVVEQRDVGASAPRIVMSDKLAGAGDPRQRLSVCESSAVRWSSPRAPAPRPAQDGAQMLTDASLYGDRHGEPDSQGPFTVPVSSRAE